jgi:hypothetical protein
MNTTKNTDIINKISQFIENANDKQLKEITEMFSNMNVKNRNDERTKIFTERILEKQNEKKNRYLTFLESSSVNGLIWAPTQVGKSNSTREFIEASLKANVPVIVSTDNKTDQCEQLLSRIQNDLSGADVTMMKVSDKSFSENIKQCIKNKCNRFVIFCLDNSSQIEKLILNLSSLATRFSKEMKGIKKIAIIHDEADQITKDKNTTNIVETQAESHKKWLELINLINKSPMFMGHIDLKRIFVTATPENCVMLYKIDAPDVMKLEIPSTYIGYKNIEYNELEDDLDIKQILQQEVRRIKSDETNEVILYCIDRKIVDGHDKVLTSLSSYLKCIVNTYNGNGITAYLRTVQMSKRFESYLKKKSIKYKRDEKYFTINNLAIRKFYTICKKIGENCVVTIGKDLISRGISYVGEDTHKPLTATTMIYKPGMSMHAVGISQTIGRITGCAMPGLKRRLYAPKDIINTYIGYNKNQEMYIKKIESETKLTKDIINEMVFEKINRHIDRTKLGLKMNTQQVETLDSIETIDDESRMKRLINLWWKADTIIGKILRYIYENVNGVSENELKDFILSINGVPRTWYTDLNTPNKHYILVFERTNENITRITKNTRDYIKTL